jgi:hypothetical protein
MAPPTKGHPSYQAPPTKGHPSYQASFRSTEIVNTAKLSPSKKKMIIYTLSKMIITLYCGNEVYLLAKTVSQIRMTIPTTVFKSNSYGYTHQSSSQICMAIPTIVFNFLDYRSSQSENSLNICKHRYKKGNNSLLIRSKALIVL